MLGANGFTTLLPMFQIEWGLSNTQAGLVAGCQYFGFMLTVPVLSALTDRFDARRVVLCGLGVVVATSYLFAFVADGFWSALIIRSLYGTGFAATYMPGLRALTDQIDDPAMKARATTWYLVAFSTGVALSILIAGQLAPPLGWRGSFGIVAALATVAFALNIFYLPRRRAAPAQPPTLREVFDFRPVLRHRPAMAYVVGQCGHTWEMFAIVSWTVAFLMYVSDRAAGTSGWPRPTEIATLAAFAGIPASLIGGGLAASFGRRKVILTAMVASCGAILAFPWVADFGYPAAAMFVMVVMMLIYVDSPVLTAGLVANAPEGRAGAAMGLHTFLGFGGGFLGPLAFGAMLDTVGRESTMDWSMAFATAAVAGMIGWLPMLRWGR